MKNYLKLIIYLVAVFTMSSCALGTDKIKISYLPGENEKTPLLKVNSKEFLIEEFKDQRKERDRIAHKKNTYGQVMGKVVADKEISQIIAEALANELRLGNHKVVLASANENAKPDYIIDGNINEFWVDTKIHLIDIEPQGTIVVDLRIRDPKDQRVLFLKTYRGYHSVKKMGAWMGTFQAVLNESLRQLVKNITQDDEFLQLINSPS